MTITLPPELEALVNRKVAEGLYESHLQVIEVALMLLDRRDSTHVEHLRAKIAVGLEELNRQEGVPSDAVFQGLREQSRLTGRPDKL